MEQLPWFDFRTLEDGDHEILIEYKPSKAKQKMSKKNQPYNVYFYKIKHNQKLYMCSFFESVATAEFPQGINGADVGDSIRITKMKDKLMYVLIGQGQQQPYKPTHTPSVVKQAQDEDLNMKIWRGQALNLAMAHHSKSETFKKTEILDLWKTIYEDPDFYKPMLEGFIKQQEVPISHASSKTLEEFPTDLPFD